MGTRVRSIGRSTAHPNEQPRACGDHDRRHDDDHHPVGPAGASPSISVGRERSDHDHHLQRALAAGSGRARRQRSVHRFVTSGRGYAEPRRMSTDDLPRSRSAGESAGGPTGYDERDLARPHHPQARPGEPLELRGVVESRDLDAQVGVLGFEFRGSTVDVGDGRALVEIPPDRHDRHHDQDRHRDEQGGRAAREPRPIALETRAWRRTAPRRRRAHAGLHPNDALTSRSAGSRRRPGSAPARRAPPRSAATGCTWRSARPSWAHPS